MFNSYDVAIDSSTKCTPPFNIKFPLMAGGVYAGGNPDLDRVVYEYTIRFPPWTMTSVFTLLSGDFCSCMTHTGAVGMVLFTDEDGLVYEI